jgi:hypothetical protein
MYFCVRYCQVLLIISLVSPVMIVVLNVFELRSVRCYNRYLLLGCNVSVVIKSFSVDVLVGKHRRLAWHNYTGG